MDMSTHMTLWREKRRDVLSITFNIKHIEVMMSIDPYYYDFKSYHDILSERPVEQLRTIIIEHQRRHSKSLEFPNNSKQCVEYILHLVLNSIFSLADQGPSLNRQTHEDVTISSLDSNLWNSIETIPFLSWVRAALGHHVAPLMELLAYATEVRRRISAGQTKVVFEKDKMVVHPLTWWALSSDDKGPASEPFQNLFSIIRSVIVNGSDDLQTTQIPGDKFRGMLLRLQILEDRKTVADRERTKFHLWRIGQDMELLECCENDSIEEYAIKKTEEHVIMLGAVRLDAILERSPVFETVCREWENIREGVRECLTLRLDFASLFLKLASKFFELKNMHGMMAVLFGLGASIPNDLRGVLAASRPLGYSRLVTCLPVAIPFMSVFWLGNKMLRPSAKCLGEALDAFTRYSDRTNRHIWLTKYPSLVTTMMQLGDHITSFEESPSRHLEEDSSLTPVASLSEQPVSSYFDDFDERKSRRQQILRRFASLPGFTRRQPYFH